ncbi:MAG: hypothetical protein CM15mV13_2740 [uncultured marine virus]|nr:MAG: hypothetical protein CM15mV13_2740 [uncultured marine virus]
MEKNLKLNPFSHHLKTLIASTMELKCKYCGITPPKNYWNCQRWLDKHEKTVHKKQVIMAMADTTQKYFDKFVEWDKKLIKKFQDRFKLSDYKMLCISFAKGFIIGAILL